MPITRTPASRQFPATFDERLRIYINFARLLVERDLRIYRQQRTVRMATPAAISKLVETAKRAKSEMDDAERMAPLAERTVDNFVSAKQKFSGHLTTIKQRTDEFNSAMAELGNAAEAMNDVFRDDTPKPQTAGNGTTTSATPVKP